MRKDLYKELFEVENNHWWHDHKRKVIHQMIDRFNNKKGKVLDVGAGTGKILRELKDREWEVTGVDEDKKAIKWSEKRGIEISHADVQKRLPFNRNFFDLVLALDVLEHLDNPDKVLQEMRRILKPKGVAIVTVPAYQWLFNYWDEMLGHRKRYSKKSLKKIVNQGDFKIEYLGYFSMFILPLAVLVRLVKKLVKQTQTSDFLTTPISFISIPVIKMFNKIERGLLSFMKLPFGLSVICMIRKK